MTLEGVVHSGTVIPDGTRVQVIVPESVVPQPTFHSLLELAGTVNDLPSDMALSHDHYLHAHLKR
jgi:hypothetical protein